MDVYKDTTTRNKLIFPSAITRIIRHFFAPCPKSSHFTVMDAISVMSVRRSKAQLRLKWPRIETATPPAPSIPSTSAPFSSSGGVILKEIMVQLQCMDAHLDTLTDELSQVTIRVGRIAQRQARLGGFVPSPSPSPSLEASKDEDVDDGSSDDNDEDEDVSSSNDEKMTTSQ